MKYLYELKAALEPLQIRKDALIGAEARVPVPAAHIRKNASDLAEELDREQDGGAIIETFRVTDSGVDREGDIIFSSGMDVSNYSAGGSLLWGHRADSPDLVLGAPAEITKGDTAIDIAFRFATEDENPTGAMVGRMVRAGLVSGTSVGILIREYSEAQDRQGFMPLNIFSSELMEVSVTPIPANPRALRAQLNSDDQKALTELYERWADEAVVTSALPIRAGTRSDAGTGNQAKAKTPEQQVWEALKELSRDKVSVAVPDPAVAAFLRGIGK